MVNLRFLQDALTDEMSALPGIMSAEYDLAYATYKSQHRLFMAIVETTRELHREPNAHNHTLYNELISNGISHETASVLSMRTGLTY